MKNLVFVLTIVLTMALSDGYSQNRSINFNENSWSEIQALAKKENKMIFLDAFASWCGPCKWMAANIFTNDTVADYYNKTFICAKIDMEKGEGVTLSEKYQVRAYPTLLFIDTAGNMVHKKVGSARKIQDYIDLGIKAQDPEKRLSATLKKYESGSLDPAFIYLLVGNMEEAYMPVDEPLRKYFATLKNEDLVKRENWKIIYRFCDDMNSPEFKYLISHENDFINHYTKDSVQSMIYQVYSYELNKLFRTRPFQQAAWDNLIVQIKSSGFSGANMVVLDAQLNLLASRRDTTKLIELALKEVNPVYWNDYSKLNNVAWQVFTMTKDKSILTRAAEWAKRSVELKDEPSNNDTYASILFRLGKKDEAIAVEKKAIELAKKMKMPFANYEEALTKMQSGK
ncbi:MAG: thioredoxin domain-containing protein [bacterium]